MARIRLIHWKAAEAAPLQAALEAAGHEVAYVERVGSRLMGHLRDQPPDAVVIDLSRLPSHGRMVAAAIRASRRHRALPLIFYHGAPEKVAPIRKLFPDADYVASLGQLLALIPRVRANPKAVAPEVAPDRDTARKLGIGGRTEVSVIDPPRDYVAVLGPLPAGAVLNEVAEASHDVTLWFVHDSHEFETRLREARRWAARTKLWILWRKGTAGLTQLSLRQSCAAFGLVDYKICSVNTVWSGMLFTVKKLQ